MDNRILYAAEALFVGPSPATGSQPSGSILQLHRVQSCGYDFNRQLEDVREFGTYAPIDRVELQLPQITLNASYLATNVRNESGIGLYVGGDLSVLTNILNKTQNEKNYYIRVVPDGNSAAGYGGTDGGVVAFGNGTVASYQAQGQVGSFPTAQFTVQALDSLWTNTSSNFDTPAINPVNGLPITGVAVTLPPVTTGLASQISALQPGDITVDLAGAGLGINNLFIQSYNVQFDLNLEALIGLGYKFPAAREPNFPIDCKLSVEANMRDMGTGRLSNIRCNDTKYDITVTLRTPTCDGTQGNVKAKYTLKGAILEGQSFNSTIGPSKSVTLNFSAPIGGPQDTGVGLFVSGALV